ncbi:MAG: Dihydroorotate dehydrogenase (NAD(+)), catalytic subunit, partial [uncultured Rubrobacteraceae bacterium]
GSAGEDDGRGPLRGAVRDDPEHAARPRLGDAGEGGARGGRRRLRGHPPQDHDPRRPEGQPAATRRRDAGGDGQLHRAAEPRRRALHGGPRRLRPRRADLCLRRGRDGPGLRGPLRAGLRGRPRRGHRAEPILPERRARRPNLLRRPRRRRRGGGRLPRRRAHEAALCQAHPRGRRRKRQGRRGRRRRRANGHEHHTGPDHRRPEAVRAGARRALRSRRQARGPQGRPRRRQDCRRADHRRRGRHQRDRCCRVHARRRDRGPGRHGELRARPGRDPDRVHRLPAPGRHGRRGAHGRPYL